MNEEYLKEKVDNLRRELKKAKNDIEDSNENLQKKDESVGNWQILFVLMSIFAGWCYLVAAHAMGWWLPAVWIILGLIASVCSWLLFCAIKENPMYSITCASGFGLFGFVAWLILR